MALDIKEFIIEIGFGKNEAEVYSALVEIGGLASVLDISKKTKIHRSNIYDSLRKLVREGFIYEVNKQKKMFKARSPRSLLNYIKRKELELQELIKDFESKSSFKKDAELAKVSTGLFALREAVNSLNDTQDPIYVFGIPGKAPDLIGPMLKEFHRERINKKIMMKHIYNASAIERTLWLNKLPYTEGKTLLQKYDSEVTTIIKGDKVIIFVWENEIQVIEMINDHIAKTYKNYFEILWKKAHYPHDVKKKISVIVGR